MQANTYKIMDFGAIGDNETLNTKAFSNAINSAFDNGGGVVYVPPGEFLTGTIHLRSNVTLYLEAGATIYGDPKSDDYLNSCLIHAEDAINVAVRGRGTIDGNGRAFFVKTDKGWERGPKRPRTFILKRCENLMLEDFTLKNSGSWAIHPLDCDRVTIRGLSLVNGNYEWGGRNADGIDLDGCINVRISDCYLETGDDAIVLKCTRSSQRGECSNITVTNCVLKTDETALKIGSETSGTFRCITFSNCSIIDSGCGVGLWMRDGGLVDGWVVSNISMNVTPDFSRGGQALYMWAYPRTDDVPCGTVKNVSISNITARGDGGIFISGTPESHIEGITLDKIRITMRGKLHKKWHEDPPHPFTVWGHHSAPYDIFCRYVDDMELRDIRYIWNKPEKPEWGSAMRFVEVNDLVVDGFQGRQAMDSGKPAVELSKVKNALFRNCVAPEGTGTFLKVGEACSRISLMNNDLGYAEKMYEGAEPVVCK
jgi:polygalacturonase